MSSLPLRRDTVPGASFVATRSYDDALVMATETLHCYGSMLVTGPTGVGKTVTCRQVMADLARDYQVPGVWVQLGSNPTPKEVVSQLLLALGMRPQRGEPTWVLARELGDLLATEPRVVWVDEAHHLRTNAFTTIRTIHDRPDARWMLGLVGTERLTKRLKTDQPEILSRTGRHVHMHRIEDRTELLDTLAAWHPLLATCPPERLVRMNRVGPRGQFRKWEQLLATLIRLTEVSGDLSEQVEALALRQCGYTLPAELTRWLS